MNIRKKTEAIKIFLYEFSFLIENGQIITKFPCFFSISIKCGKQFMQTKEQQKSIGNIIKCTQKLSFKTQINFYTDNDNYQPKYATLLIQIRSQKKPKEKLTIGVLNIQLTKAINNAQMKKLQKYMLQKSPNKEDFLNISISATCLKQIESINDRNQLTNSQNNKFSHEYKNISASQKTFASSKTPSKQKLTEDFNHENHMSTSLSKSITPQSFAFKAIESQYWTPKQNHRVQSNQLIELQEINNNKLLQHNKKNVNKEQPNNDLQVTFSNKRIQNTFKRKADNLNGLNKNQNIQKKLDFKISNENSYQISATHKQKFCANCIQKTTKLKLMFKQFAHKQNELKQNINQLENYFKKLNEDFQKQILKSLQYQKKLHIYENQVKTTKQKLIQSQENKKQKEKQLTDLVLEVVQQKLNQYTVMEKQSQIQLLKKNNNAYLKQIGIKQQKISNLSTLVNNKQQQLAILRQQCIKLHQLIQDYTYKQTQYLIEIENLRKGKHKQQIQTMTEPQFDKQPSKFQQISKVQRQCYELNYKVNEYALYEQTLRDKIKQQIMEIESLKQKNQQFKKSNKQLITQLENIQKQIIKQEVEVEKIKKQQFSHRKLNKSRKESKQSALPTLINHIANIYDTKTDEFSKISNLEQTIMLLMQRNKKLLKKIKVLNEEKVALVEKIAELSGSNDEKSKYRKNSNSQNAQICQDEKIDQILQFADYQKQDFHKYLQEDHYSK